METGPIKEIDPIKVVEIGPIKEIGPITVVGNSQARNKSPQLN